MGQTVPSVGARTTKSMWLPTGNGHVTNGSEGGNTFTGTLSVTAGTYDFHYYYVGNQTIANEATSFTMDFSDQDGTLANLGDFHVGYGTQANVEVTEGETVSAQASMQTLVAMAYFDIAGMAETGEKVFFYGDNINNQMTIDFSTNTPTYEKKYYYKSNLICVGTVVSGSTCPVYVMLLPNHTDGSEDLPTDITFISKRTTGTCYGVFNYGIIGGRFYCKDGNPETPIDLDVAPYDEGALRGVFGISLISPATVRFSQGNLQYIGSASSPYWQLATNQWDYLGNNGQASSSTTVDRDLFGWGTSGYNHGAVCYQPWSTSTSNSDYYAYGQYNNNLYDGNGQADWGYNAIGNGGNAVNSGWRTLTRDEWDYVISYRNTTSRIRYAKAQVNGVCGLILLPDNWNSSYYSLSNTNSSGIAYEYNKITAEEWSSTLEPHGAVFLPAGGYRNNGAVISAGYLGMGLYWSSSYADSDKAGRLSFGNSTTGTFYDNRYYGYSVRLIHN